MLRRNWLPQHLVCIRMTLFRFAHGRRHRTNITAGLCRPMLAIANVCPHKNGSAGQLSIAAEHTIETNGSENLLHKTMMLKYHEDFHFEIATHNV